MFKNFYYSWQFFQSSGLLHFLNLIWIVVLVVLIQETAFWWGSSFGVWKWWKLLKYKETWIWIHIFISTRSTWVIKYRCNCLLDISQVDNITIYSLLNIFKIVCFFLVLWLNVGQKKSSNYTDLLLSLVMRFQTPQWRMLCSVLIKAELNSGFKHLC